MPENTPAAETDIAEQIAPTTTTTEDDRIVRLPDGREMTQGELTRKLRTLRATFGPDHIERKPQVLKKDDKRKGRCAERSQVEKLDWNGNRTGKWEPISQDHLRGDEAYYCGGWHAPAIHLHYVGHAGVTDRLNDVDPFWTIDFMTKDQHGRPLIDSSGTWFYITVLGVTRPCIGDAKSMDGNGQKEILGDAIRNGAMRFGVGTYLWAKSQEALAKKRFELGLNEDGTGQAGGEDDNQEAWSQDKGTARDQARGSQTTLEGQVEKTIAEWETDYNRALAAGPDAMYSLRTIARSAKAPDEVLGAINKCLADYEASQREAAQQQGDPSAAGHEPQGDVAQDQAHLSEQQ